jgi:long-chain acyl-CoA synthetase
MDELSHLLCQVASHGGRTAILQDGEVLSYTELMRRSNGFAGYLLSNGFGERGFLASALPNGREQLIVHLGAFLAGVPLIRLRPTAPSPQLHHCLKTIPTLGLVASGEIIGSIDREYLPKFVVEQDWFDRCAEQPKNPGVVWQNIELIAAENSDRIATITFTSGTTARPKGVIHSRRAVANAVKRAIGVVGYQPEDVVLVRMAMYAQIGMIVQALPALVVGATVELANAIPSEAYRKAMASRPLKTLFFEAPVVLADVMRNPDATGAGMEQLRAIWAGGDFITPRIQSKIFAITGRYVSVAYGMTEVGLISVLHPTSRRPEGGLVGFPLPDTRVRIVDDLGQEVASNQKGNIQVMAPSSFDGYWNLPELTRSVLGPDGWISTGDIGRLSDSGELQLLGRSKEMMVINNWKVAPIEVETVLVSHPGVQQAVVVGVEDDEGKTRIEAFVVPREGFEPSPSREDILELANERLEKFMVPSEVYFVRRLPHFPTGKVDRERLAMISLAGLLGDLL